jgi:hypothetical protein
MGLRSLCGAILLVVQLGRYPPDSGSRVNFYFQVKIKQYLFLPVTVCPGKKRGVVRAPGYSVFIFVYQV